MAGAEARFRLGSAASVLVGNGVAGVLLLAGLIIVGRAVGAAAYGELATVIALAGLVSILAEAGLHTYVIRERVSGGPASVHENALRLRLFLGLVGAGVVVAASWLAYGQEVALLAALYAGTIPGTSMANLVATSLNSTEAFRRLALFRVLEAALTTALASAAAVATRDVTWVCLAFTLSALASYGVARILTRPAGVRLRRGGLDWMPLRVSAWFAATPLITYLTGRATVALIAPMVGPAELGNYAAAMRLVDAPMIAVSALMVASFPNWVRAAKAGELAGARVLRSTMGWAALGAAVTFPVALLCEPATDFLLGAEYPRAGALLAILVWIFPLGLAAMPTSLLADATGLQSLHTLNGLYMVATTLGLAATLVGPFGASGAALAVVAGRLVGLVGGAGTILVVATRRGLIHWAPRTTSS